MYPVSVLYFLAIAIGISEKSVSTNSARSFWSHCAMLATPAAAATGVDKAKPRIEQLNQNRHQHWDSDRGMWQGGGEASETESNVYLPCAGEADIGLHMSSELLRLSGARDFALKVTCRA